MVREEGKRVKREWSEVRHEVRGRHCNKHLESAFPLYPRTARHGQDKIELLIRSSNFLVPFSFRFTRM
jgi:hypothetical protein